MSRIYVYYSSVPRALGAADVRIMWTLPNEVYNFITMSRKDSWRFKNLQNSKKSSYGKIRGGKGSNYRQEFLFLPPVVH